MHGKFVLIALGLACSAAAAAADVSALVKTCDDCHGEKGVSRWSDVPTIAGVSPVVLSDAIGSYRSKERPCEPSEYRQGDKTRQKVSMCTVAGKLSDAEVDAVGQYYAKQRFVAAKQPFDAALAKQGKAIHDRDCEKCHTDNARDPAEDAGILAGQWTGYLKAEFANFKAGKREQPKKMKVKLDKLTDQDIKALLNFYASLQ